MNYIMGQLLGDFCASLQVSVQDGSVCLNPRLNKHYRDQGQSMLRADYYMAEIMGQFRRILCKPPCGLGWPRL